MSDNRYAEPIFHFLLCICIAIEKPTRAANNINNILQFYKKSVTIKATILTVCYGFIKKIKIKKQQ